LSEWYLFILTDHLALNLDCAPQAVDDARKQDQQAIASGPYNSTAEFLDFGTNERIVEVFQVSMRALVIGAYQPAIADDVGCKNGHQTPLDAFAHQSSLHRRRNRPTTRRPAV
jgi:hypothetical protein